MGNSPSTQRLCDGLLERCDVFRADRSQIEQHGVVANTGDHGHRGMTQFCGEAFDAPAANRHDPGVELEAG